MEPEVPKPKTPRRWRKSLIVLGIGLAYLAAVYLLVPETHPLSNMRGTRYGPGLRGFEQRLIERAAKIERLRMTVVSKGPYAGRRVVGTLLLDGKKRVRVETKGGGVWQCAWVHDGTEGWHIVHSPGKPYFHLETFDAIDDIRRSDDLFGFSWEHEVVALYPYVSPRKLQRLLSGARVTLVGEEKFRGKRCRILRVEERSRRFKERVDLWIIRDEQRVVKTEATSAFRFGLLRKWLFYRKIVSVVTEFDDDATFKDSEFDPVPLIRAFADAVKRGTDEILTTEELLRGQPAEPDSDGAEDVGEN